MNANEYQRLALRTGAFERGRNCDLRNVHRQAELVKALVRAQHIRKAHPLIAQVGHSRLAVEHMVLDAQRLDRQLLVKKAPCNLIIILVALAVHKAGFVELRIDALREHALDRFKGRVDHGEFLIEQDEIRGPRRAKPAGETGRNGSLGAPAEARRAVQVSCFSEFPGQICPGNSFCGLLVHCVYRLAMV